LKRGGIGGIIEQGRSVKRRRWKALLPGAILIAVARLPLLALQMTNADLLALRMAWPVYSVPLMIVGCIALMVGVVVVISWPREVN